VNRGQDADRALDPAASAWPGWLRKFGAVHATLLYTLLAVAWTWPLATGLATDVPWDLGDPLLNCWILAWHFHQAGRLLRGDVGAFADWWHPNIFHPSPYALGQSELLVAQALQGAPIQALTGNILLTYNLLFLSSFVLAALGAFLLVRSLTRQTLAGIVGGLFYGFALYRVNQGPHLQVLSSQWFPFVLWGLHEWWEHGRRRHAVMAGLALALQNLSNGYFLVYAALWLPPYVLAQMALRGRLRDRRAWLGPLICAGVGVALTAPWLYPYAQLRALGQPRRPLVAVVQYSADTYAWLTANAQLRFWGSRLDTLVRAEGDLFPGVVPLALVLVALVLAGQRRWPASHAAVGAPGGASVASRLRGIAEAGLAILAIGHVVAILAALFAGRSRLHLGPVTVSITDGTRLLIGLAASTALLLVVSRRARAVLRDEPQHPVVLWTLLGAFTVWLSLGPIVHIGGRTARTWPSLYAAAYEVVPGADALRVPPRIAMVTALALSVIGGLAVASLSRRRAGVAASGVLAVAFTAESWPAPVPVHTTYRASYGQGRTEPVPPRPADHPLAQAIAALPADAVLVDLPFGAVPDELWWQYLSIGHWRPRLNGYSGDVPPGHLALQQTLTDLPAAIDGGVAAGTLPDAAMQAIRGRGATHVLLHRDSWPSAEAPDALRRWLRDRGASLAATVGATEIWSLRP
jgi:hypothetical protein